MEPEHPTDDEQTRLWNGHAGRAWVDAQPIIDEMFRPIEALLIEGIAAGSAAQVLDVGCGTGATTLAAARRLGGEGGAVGIDLSAPMIEVARARAAREGSAATFVCADAQSHAFEPGGFDRILSRFGVMFFNDPVAAFANLRRAARDGAELGVVAWRSPAENPFMTTAERAATPLLPNLPPRRPDGPGQFAFADPGRVRAILEGSGWSEVELRPLDVTCSLPEPALARYLARFGPVGLALAEVDEPTRERILEAVRAAFEPFVDGAMARYTAACWMVGARAT